MLKKPSQMSQEGTEHVLGGSGVTAGVETGRSDSPGFSASGAGTETGTTVAVAGVCVGGSAGGVKGTTALELLINFLCDIITLLFWLFKS